MMRSLLLLCCTLGLAYFAQGADPNYAAALGLGWVFYEAQQSGNLPCWNRVAWWQPGGYRISSHVNDGKSDSIDLAGGWYDAGDHIKNTQALGWAVSTLAWGYLEFPQAYEATKQKPIMMRNLKWAADWLVKAHYEPSDDPKKNSLVGQVGDPSTDHKKWWKPNDEPTSFCRAVIKVNCDHPGSDVASEAAAALTAVSIIFKDSDAAYAADLLKHAKQLFAFAKACPGIWSLVDDATIYPSNSFRDDMAWAAAWLCKADASFCKEATDLWNKAKEESKGKFNSDWDNVFPQTTVLLMSTSLNTGRGAIQPFISYMETLLFNWQDSPTNCTKDAQDYKTCISNNGLLFTTAWGNMPKAANVALLSMAYSKYLASRQQRVKRRCWARQQVSLMLGNSGRSFMVGLGTNAPVNPHHRAASCPTDPCKQCGAPPFNLINDVSIDGVTGSNPNVLWGALVGGQDSQAQYKDLVLNYRQNEAAVDWNAGITGAVAGLVWFNNAFPSTTWQQYCSQKVNSVPEEALFDDTNPSTTVPTPATPTFNVTVKTPAVNSPASATSPADYLKNLLDPETGMDKCSGNANAPGPATSCPASTVADNQYTLQCSSNYYGKQKKELATKNAAVGVKLASSLLAVVPLAFAWLVL